MPYALYPTQHHVQCLVSCSHLCEVFAFVEAGQNPLRGHLDPPGGWSGDVDHRNVYQQEKEEIRQRKFR